MQSRIMDSPIQTRVCEGSVALHKGSEHTIVTEDATNVRMNVDKVVVEGCGCFTLHTKKIGKKGGNSFFLEGTGEWILNMRVRSVRIVECGDYA